MLTSQLAQLPCRADQVGSLLRPPELLAARVDNEEGRISAEQLRKIEDAAIVDVVRMQEEIGLKSVTDGEFRRGSWHMDFLYQIGGVAKEKDNLKVQFQNERGGIEFTPTRPKIVGKLQLRNCIFGEAFNFLKSATISGTPKLAPTTPKPLIYIARAPARTAMRAESASNAPGRTRSPGRARRSRHGRFSW